MKNVFGLVVIFTVMIVCVTSYTAETKPEKVEAAPAAAKKEAPAKGHPVKKEEPKVDMNVVSYIIGHNIGTNFKQQEIKADIDNFVEGFKAALAGKDSKISDAETQKIMMAFQKKMAAEGEARHQKMIVANKVEGDKFLAENKKKEGIVVTKSGLQYQIIKKGEGATPKGTDTVVVKYRGTFLDGKEFDNSAKQPGGTVSFPVNGVIPGWTEALKLMKVGAKWKLFIPGEIAYGARGNRGIEPNKTLLFDIELVEIKAPAPAAAAPKGKGMPISQEQLKKMIDQMKAKEAANKAAPAEAKKPAK